MAIIMKYGRLTDNIYERSVVKVVKRNSDKNRKFYEGAGLGADCALFHCKDDKTINKSLVSGQAMAHGKDINVVLRAYVSAINNAIVKGGVKDLYANITIMVPERLREIKIRQMLEKVVTNAEITGVPVLGADVNVIPAVGEIIANCVVSGLVYDEDIVSCKASVGDDIVMTKWIGLEGTVMLANNYYEELCTKYHRDIVDGAKSFEQYLSVATEASIAKEQGASAVQVIRSGGVFGALWELGENNKAGLIINLNKIPVKQETVEICEYFDINPYELLSGGGLLVTTSDSGKMIYELEKHGISATVIGTITDGNDRCIRHDDEMRYLEPAKGDEIYKILQREGVVTV